MWEAHWRNIPQQYFKKMSSTCQAPLTGACPCTMVCGMQFRGARLSTQQQVNTSTLWRRVSWSHKGSSCAEPYKPRRRAHHAVPVDLVPVAEWHTLVVGGEGFTAGGGCRRGRQGGADRRVGCRCTECPMSADGLPQCRGQRV